MKQNGLHFLSKNYVTGRSVTKRTNKFCNVCLSVRQLSGKHYLKRSQHPLGLRKSRPCPPPPPALEVHVAHLLKTFVDPRHSVCLETLASLPEYYLPVLAQDVGSSSLHCPPPPTNNYHKDSSLEIQGAITLDSFTVYLFIFFIFTVAPCMLSSYSIITPTTAHI